MNRESSDQIRYYQTISHFLFNLRGAPFILSAREINIIEEWEGEHIPLDTVLEGIKSAYETFRSDRRYRKIFTLNFCNRFVFRAFSQYKERRVGKKSEGKTDNEKIEMIRSEIKRFINHISKEVLYLREIYLKILDDLSLENIDEEALEQRDEQIDRLLLAHLKKSDRDKHRKDSTGKHQAAQESEKNHIANRRYIKSVREKYKIPYVSIFYY